MSAIDDLARVLATRAGKGVDEVRPVLDDVSEREAEQFLQGMQGRSAGGEALVQGTRVLADQPRRAAGEVTSGLSKPAAATAVGVPTAIGGSFVLKEHEQTLQAEKQREAKAQQASALEKIMSDPHLSSEEKKELVDKLTGAGFFDKLTPDSDDSSGLLPSVLQGAGMMEWVVVLILVYFGGKALVAAFENSGGGD